ncbi:SCO7613 C-terminal domain-containing membrane protein [Streptodolium elevatio]
MCERCALPLTGPLAAELWTVSTDAKRLLEKRTVILRRMRAATVPVPKPASPPAVGAGAGTGDDAAGTSGPPRMPVGTATHPPVQPVPTAQRGGRWRREVFGALPVTRASATAAAGTTTPTAASATASTTAPTAQAAAAAAAALSPAAAPPRPSGQAPWNRSAARPPAAHGTGAGPGAAPGSAPAVEVGRRRVARLILGTGVLFLIIAAIVFVAMTWQRTGTGGRAIVMALMLVAAAAGTAVAERRDLPLTAEALGVVAVALGLLDGYAAYAADLGGVRGSGGLLVSAVTVAAVGGAALAGSMVLGLRTLRVSAALLLQAPVPLLAGHIGESRDSLLPLAIGFTAQAAAEVALLHWAFRTPVDAAVKADGHAAPARSLPKSPAVRTALLASAAYWLAAFGLAVSEAGRGPAAITMVTVAVTAGFVARVMRAFGAIRHVASGAATVAFCATLLLSAALTDDDGSGSDISTGWAVAALSVFMLVLVALVHAVPRAYRAGPLVVLSLPFAVGAVTAVVSVASALFGPVSWLSHPWSAEDGGWTGARDVLTPSGHWEPGAAPSVIIVAVALTVGVAAHQLGRRAWWRMLGLITVVSELVVAPFVFDVPMPVAIAYQVVAGAGLTAAAGRLFPIAWQAHSARAAGFALVALGTVWSLADEAVSVAVWGPGALVLVGLAAAVPATLRPALAGTATAMLFTDAAMAAAWRGVDGPVIAAGLAVAASALVAAGVPVARRRPALGWPVVGVAGAWALGAAAMAHPDERAFVTARGAVTAAALVGVLADAAERRPTWAGAAAAGAVSTAAVGAYAAGASASWSAVAAAATAGLILAAGPSAHTRRVSLVKGAVPDRVLLAGTVEALAALGLTAAVLNSLGDERARTVAVAVAAFAAACRMPARRSAAPGLWPPVLAALLVLTTVFAAMAADAPDSRVALLVVCVASAPYVLVPHLRASIVPLPVAVVVVLVCSAGAGFFGVVGTRPELAWFALLVTGAAGVLAGGVPSRVPGMTDLRRASAGTGAALLLAAYWTGLGTAGVAEPEPYTVLPGVLLLAGGRWLRGRRPELHSWAAYGAGLALTLLPSLPLAISDDAALRPALLGAAALTSLVVGARFRLQAPLLMGVGTLAVLAVFQLTSPVLAAYHALPRWGIFAGAGALLILLGWTYERRLRDLARLGRTVRALD